MIEEENKTENNTVDLSNALDEVSEEQEKYQQEHLSEDFSPGKSKMVQWVVKFSGGLIGAYEATFGIGWAVGPLFAGIVSEAFGKDAPYLGFFVIGIIVALIIILKRNTLQVQWKQNQ